MTDHFRFLHAADLHLDSPLRGLDRYEGAPVDAIRDASRRAFENLVAGALEERVEFIVLAGDVFDGDWRDFGTGLFFASQLRRLGDAGIRVYLLAGNHDAAANMTRHLVLPDNVFQFPVTRAATLRDEPTGVALHGQGFPTRAVETDLAAHYPDAVPGAFNIGVLHTALEGRAGHDTYAPCSLATLRSKGYRYWALGHVHAREVVSQDPWVVFPGNLQGRHARETGAKGATLVEVVDGQVSSVEHRDFDVLRFAQLEVDAAAVKSFDAAVDRAEQALRGASNEAAGRMVAVRLHFTGRSEIDGALRHDRERLLAELRNRANEAGDVWIEDAHVRTSPSVPGEGRDLIEALGLDDGSLHSTVLEAVREDALPLLSEIRERDAAPDELLREALSEARELVVQRLLDTASGAPPGAAP